MHVEIKQVHYWTMWDLDTILHIGNETCSHLRCIDEYLSSNRPPSIGKNILDLQKSETISGILDKDTVGFLRFVHQKYIY